MSDDELVRQWKNPRDRTTGLDHPAGEIALDELVGGREPSTERIASWGCCPTGPYC